MINEIKNGLGAWIAVSAVAHAVVLLTCIGTGVVPSFERGETSLEVEFIEDAAPAQSSHAASPAGNIQDQPLNNTIATARVVTTQQPEASSIVFDVSQAAAASRPPLSPHAANRMLSKGAMKAPSTVSSIRPKYPVRSRLLGEEGVVKVQVIVSARGRAQSARIVSSSGHALLDQSAVDAAQRASYVPARFMGIPIEAGKMLEFVFRLVEQRG